MRRWLLWMIISCVMISILIRNSSYGEGGYSPARGVLDSSFGNRGIVVYNNPNHYDEGKSIYVDSSGKIYVTGFSGRGMVIWRYNVYGILDKTFGNNGIVVFDKSSWSIGNSIYVDKNGKIYVTGCRSNSSGNFNMMIWKYNRDGKLDKTFGNGGIVVYNDSYKEKCYDGKSIYVDSNGKIYVAGLVINDKGREDYKVIDYGENASMVVWRYNVDGTLDKTFGNGGIVVHKGAAGGNKGDRGLSIYVDKNGKIYVTGYSYNSRGNFNMVIWRYNRDGILDKTFGNRGIVVFDKSELSSGKSIYVDKNGKIYVTGISYNSNGNSDMIIWRYNEDGTLDETFGNEGIVVHNGAAGGNGNDGGNSIYVDSKGKVYVTGFSLRGGEDIKRITERINIDMVIWRYNGDGTLDETFGNGGIVVNGGNDADGGNSIYVDSNGKVYVTGISFSKNGGADMVIWKYK